MLSFAPDDFGAALTFFDREDGGQRLVFDRYRLNRLRKKMAIGMSQQQNRLLGMVHELRWPGKADRRRSTRCNFSREYLLRRRSRIHPSAMPGPKRDLPDPAARNLAANRCSKEHVGQNHIVDVLRLSGYFVAPFFARNRLADDVASCVHGSMFIDSFKA